MKKEENKKMYIKFKVRQMYPNSSDMFREFPLEMDSELPIKYLKMVLQKHCGLPYDKLDLLYSGKKLQDSFSLCQSRINSGSVVILLQFFRFPTELMESRPIIEEKTLYKNCVSQDSDTIMVSTTCSEYKVGDEVDAYIQNEEAWVEGVIKDVLLFENSNGRGTIFRLLLRFSEPPNYTDFFYEEIRPRSYHTYQLTDLKIGMCVLVNYNFEKRKGLGYWYDFEICRVNFRQRKLKGKFLSNPHVTSVISFKNDIYRIEKPKKNHGYKKNIPLRPVKFYCSQCKDKGRKCLECGCAVCKRKVDESNILLCDECDEGYHIYCLDPPLESIPEDDWYCPNCKNPSHNYPGEPGSSSQINKLSRNSSTKEIGNLNDTFYEKSAHFLYRPNITNIVLWEINLKDEYEPSYHGDVYQVRVGEIFDTLDSLYNAGVHKSLKSHIHANPDGGAYSVILDVDIPGNCDLGETIYFKGCGASTFMISGANKALAQNCHAFINSSFTTEAQDWRQGEPVRVIRKGSTSPQSPFVPEYGYRYDGLYKVARYECIKCNLSSLYIWIFVLKRDDYRHAPWSVPTLNHFTSSFVIPMMYSSLASRQYENYIEFSKICGDFDLVEYDTSTLPDDQLPANKSLDDSLLFSTPRRRNPNSCDFNDNASLDDSDSGTLLHSPSNFNSLEYLINDKLLTCIKRDVENEIKWSDALSALQLGHTQFYNSLIKNFRCIVCNDILKSPVHLHGEHSSCRNCIFERIDNCAICPENTAAAITRPPNQFYDLAMTAIFPWLMKN